MGNYSKKLSKRLRNAPLEIPPRSDVERLKCAAIQREGKTHDGFRSHYELRSALGDVYPQISRLEDVEGFLTTLGRFVTREEAQDVALVSGQIRQRQRRPLLSSDVDW